MRSWRLRSSVALAVFGTVAIAVMMVWGGGPAAAGPPLCDGEVATLVGTSGDDFLRGTDDDDVIVGLGGSDRIQASGGNDIVCGNDGDDMMIGGPGDDVLIGGNGVDWVAYGNAPAGVDVDLGAGTASGGHGFDRLTSVESLIGSPFHDTLSGSFAANTIRGGAQNDVIHGGPGNDLLLGGIGHDHLVGGGGDDVLDGHAHNDRLVGGEGSDLLRGWAGDDRIEPGAGDDVAKGGNGIDTLAYHEASVGVVVDLPLGSAAGSGSDAVIGFENVIGSMHDDELIGTAAGNQLTGGSGHDIIAARGGDDLVFGGSGDDTLDGGPGTDALHGGVGRDRCVNGESEDSCAVRVGVVTREEWGARDPRHEQLVPHTIGRLTVHHAGTQSSTTGPPRYRSWQAWHMDGKGWPDISYHFIVGVDGTVYEGRDPAYKTDTFTDYDTTGHFQVVLEGNFDVDRPSAAQLESLAAVLAWAAEEYDVSPSTIAGHGDHAHTACPGDHLAAYLDSGSVQSTVEALIAAGGVDLRVP